MIKILSPSVVSLKFAFKNIVKVNKTLFFKEIHYTFCIENIRDKKKKRLPKAVICYWC